METFLYHIGRDKINNQIYIDDESVSVSHAQVFVDQNKNFIIIDLSSTNGVIIDDKKIETPTQLENRHLIRLGNSFYKKEDISNAIQHYETNKKRGNENAVPLISSHPKQKLKKYGRKKVKTYRFIVTVLVAISIIIAAFVLNNYNTNQNVIKNKIFELEQNDDISKKEIELPIPVYKKTVKTKSKNDSDKKVEKKSKLKKQRIDVIYDFSCLNNKNDNGSNDMITEFGDLTRDIQSTVLKDVEISILDEKKAGNSYVKNLRKKKQFIDRGSDYLKLNKIMKDLISRIAKPRGIDYEIFFVDDKIKNVFTLGGNIVFYKGMYDFCVNDSEIAAIISHEIAHNELGHSTLELKKQKTSNNLGILGEIALMIESNISVSFNQKQEVQADLFGIDLVHPTDYNSCAGVSLWERMSKTEKDFNIAENLFKSHPYSINRINCLKNHSTNNYNKSCN